MKRGGLAFFFAVLMPVLALAQTGSGRDRDPTIAQARLIAADLQNANFRFGPFYLLSTIRLSDIGYNEEFFVPTSEHGGGVSLAIEAPQKLYFVPAKKVIVSGQITPSYNLLTGSTAQQQFNYTARGDVQLLLNHLYLDFYAAGGDRLVADTAELNRILTRAQTQIGIAGELKYSSRTSVMFNSSRHEVSYPEDQLQPGEIDVDLNDHEALQHRVALRHHTLPRTSLVVAAERADYAFTRATYKDSQRLYLGLGFIFSSGLNNVELEAGPAVLDFNDSLEKDFKGVLGRFAASRQTPRWTYFAQGNRDVQFVIFAENNFTVVDRAGAGVEYALRRTIALRAGVSAERARFEIPVFGERRRDQSAFSSVGFRVRRRKFTAGADLGWYERTSTSEFGDKESGIRYILHLSITP